MTRTAAAALALAAMAAPVRALPGDAPAGMGQAFETFVKVCMSQAVHGGDPVGYLTAAGLSEPVDTGAFFSPAFDLSAKFWPEESAPALCSVAHRTDDPHAWYVEYYLHLARQYSPKQDGGYEMIRGAGQGDVAHIVLEGTSYALRGHYPRSGFYSLWLESYEEEE
jgi:hypothetical protein